VTEPGGAQDAPVGGSTGAPFGSVEGRHWESASAGSAPPSVVPQARPPADAQEPAGRSGRGKRVRPYVRTGGRTKSSTELALETLVTVSGRTGRLTNLEYRNVIALCGVPRSIAEVAALSALPVGVARVLVGDLAEQGLLTVHETRGPSGDDDDVALMERVLAGLRRI
jgi:hypothetical protein